MGELAGFLAASVAEAERAAARAAKAAARAAKKKANMTPEEKEAAAAKEAKAAAKAAAREENAAKRTPATEKRAAARKEAKDETLPPGWVSEQRRGKTKVYSVYRGPRAGGGTGVSESRVGVAMGARVTRRPPGILYIGKHNGNEQSRAHMTPPPTARSALGASITTRTITNKNV